MRLAFHVGIAPSVGVGYIIVRVSRYCLSWETSGGGRSPHPAHGLNNVAAPVVMSRFTTSPCPQRLHIIYASIYAATSISCHTSQDRHQ